MVPSTKDSCVPSSGGGIRRGFNCQSPSCFHPSAVVRIKSVFSVASVNFSSKTSIVLAHVKTRDSSLLTIPESGLNPAFGTFTQNGYGEKTELGLS